MSGRPLIADDFDAIAEDLRRLREPKCGCQEKPGADCPVHGEAVREAIEAIGFQIIITYDDLDFAEVSQDEGAASDCA